MANDYENKILEMSYGSAQPNISPDIIEKIRIIYPEINILDLFISKINSIYDLVISTQEETQTLTKLRDELLPKLMSGEVRV